HERPVLADVLRATSQCRRTRFQVLSDRNVCLMKKMMKFLFAALGMASSALAFSQENTPAGLTAPAGIMEPPASSAAQEQNDAPRTVRTELSLRRLANGDVAVLNGLQNVQTLEFTLRKDQVVTQAYLDLAF